MKLFELFELSELSKLSENYLALFSIYFCFVCFFLNMDDQMDKRPHKTVANQRAPVIVHTNSLKSIVKPGFAWDRHGTDKVAYEISLIGMHLLSPEQIRKMSVCEVLHPNLYTKNLPKRNGINDPRMGTVDRRMFCATCFCSVAQCNGHLGHIELAFPVYHVGYLNTILKILRSHCFFCCKILLDVEDNNIQQILKTKRGKYRFHVLTDLIKKSRRECFHCNGPQPLYERVGLKITCKFSEKQWDHFTESCVEIESQIQTMTSMTPMTPTSTVVQGSEDTKAMEVHSARNEKIASLQAKLKELQDEQKFCLDHSDKNFTPREARNILEHIDMTDLGILGFSSEKSRPEYMILEVLLVPPPIMRPDIMVSEGSHARGHNDLTQKLKDIVKANIALRETLHSGTESKTVNEEKFAENLDLLQYHIATYMDNEIRGQKPALQRSGAPMRSLASRWKRKGGRIRGNLMGKRVNFSARTVISPECLRDIDWIGTPEEIALGLTFPETVHRKNIEALTKRVNIGPGKIDGAASIEKRDGGGHIDLSFCDSTQSKNVQHTQLNYGDKVHRYLQTHDIVLVNRQPSLHKPSIMAHKVKLNKLKTLQLNLSCTTPYNADFDGDEMNLHVPQTEQAKAEAAALMNVADQIVSGKNCKPCMGLVQDTLLASSLVTKKDVFLTFEEAMDLVMCIEYPQNEMDAWCLMPPAILKPVPMWTGKQIMSLLFPTIHLERVVRNGPTAQIEDHVWPLLKNLIVHGYLDPPSSELKRIEQTLKSHLFSVHVISRDLDPCMDDLERQVIIRNGELLCGSLCKATAGASSGGIVHTVVRDCGAQAAKCFLSDAQRLLNHWMVHYVGFSVGIEDCRISQRAEVKVCEVTTKAFDRIQNIMDRVDGKGIDKNKVELTVTEILTKVLKQTSQIAQSSLSNDNHLNCMVNAASKGNPVNICQIVACVAQQSIGGRRIHVQEGSRTLPSRPRKDFSPIGHGFVENSYINGLEPEECFYHAMGGREGLVDTAVKTATTGYIQRRLVKGAETCRAHYNTSVRNSEDRIIQYSYGGDGFDPVYLQRVPLKVLLFSNEHVLNTYGYSKEFIAYMAREFDLEDETDMSSSLKPIFDAEVHEIMRLRDMARHQKFSTLTPEMTSSVYVPVHVSELVDRIEYVDRMKRFNDNDETLLSIEYVQHIFDQVFILCHDIERLGDGQNHTDFLLVLRTCLSSRVLAIEKNISKNGFAYLVQTIQRLTMQARVQNGEGVGCLAATSIGEPSTQLTLNTFHYAGVGSRNVTIGVPRIKELFNATRNIKIPSLTVALHPVFHTVDHDIFASKRKDDMIKRISSLLVDTYLNSVVKSSDILNEPNCRVSSKFTNDQIILDLGNVFYEEWLNTHAMSKLVIRMVLMKSKLIDRGLGPRDIAHLMEEYICLSGTLEAQVLCSEYNSKEWVIRVRFCHMADMMSRISSETSKQQDLEKWIYQSCLNTMLNELHIHGIPGIHACTTRVVQQSYVNDDISTSKYGQLITKSETVIDTEGSSLRDMWSLDIIDWTKTYCNHIHEIHDELGLEAASAILFTEIKNVLSYDGGSINDRHILLMVDVMTHHGYIMPISRHGLNRVDTGPLVRSSFEETVEVLFEAAAYAEEDNILGPTENIMLGQKAPVGTGTVHLRPSAEYMAPHKNIERTDHTLFDTQRPTIHDGSSKTRLPQWLMGSDRKTDVMFTTPEEYNPEEGNPDNHSSSELPPTTQYGSATSPIYIPTSPSYAPRSPTSFVSPTSPTSFQPCEEYDPESPLPQTLHEENNRTNTGDALQELSELLTVYKPGDIQQNQNDDFNNGSRMAFPIHREPHGLSLSQPFLEGNELGTDMDSLFGTFSTITHTSYASVDHNENKTTKPYRPLSPDISTSSSSSSGTLGFTLVPERYHPSSPVISSDTTSVFSDSTLPLFNARGEIDMRSLSKFLNDVGPFTPNNTNT